MEEAVKALFEILMSTFSLLFITLFSFDVIASSFGRPENKKRNYPLETYVCLFNDRPPQLLMNNNEKLCFRCVKEIKQGSLHTPYAAGTGYQELKLLTGHLCW